MTWTILAVVMIGAFAAGRVTDLVVSRWTRRRDRQPPGEGPYRSLPGVCTQCGRPLPRMSIEFGEDEDERMYVPPAPPLPRGDR